MDNTQYQGGANLPDEEFDRLTNETGSNIVKMNQNVSSMSKLVNQLQTQQDSQSLRNQLIQIQTYTQRLAKDTSHMILDLMKMPLGADAAVNKLKRDRLSDDYMASLNAFQSVQRKAAQKSKDDIKKVKEQNIHIGDPFSLGGNSQVVEMDNRQQMQSEKALRELEEREKEIRQLESDILGVNQIFKELGTLIHDQGGVVDSIESNVELTAHGVEAGTRELRQAASYKNKLRKKKVYIGIVVTVIILIILILIFNH